MTTHVQQDVIGFDVPKINEHVKNSTFEYGEKGDSQRMRRLAGGLKSKLNLISSLSLGLGIE